MTVRDTGRTVTLPLVWRGDALYAGPWQLGYVHQWQNGTGWGWWTVREHHRPWERQSKYGCDFTTRAEAEAAVEAAVLKAFEA